MGKLRIQGALALAASATALSETPVEKVITLLTDLKAQVQEEGKTEAGTYDTFACFCKDQTKTKSESITTGQDNINSLSASIQAETAEQAEKAAELSERKTKQEGLAGDLTETRSRCLKEDAEFEAKHADLAKALKSLEGAIKALSGAKPGSLIKIKDAVKQSIALAGAFNLAVAPKHQAALQALLQKDSVDPLDPDYAFHSQSIVDMLDNLEKDFKDEKDASQSEWDKAKTSCGDLQKSISDEMKENNDAMDTLKTDIEALKSSIAEDRESLVEAESLMQEDKVYLKDLTRRCEVRAKDWDQRSQLRANEMEALSEALAILENKVLDLDSVNKRASLLLRRPVHVERVNTTASVNHTSGAAAAPSKAKSAAVQKKEASAKKPVSFLQEAVKRLRGVTAHGSKMERAQRLLQEAGDRLQKPEMSALAESIAADPFLKVKQLIQQLIEKVLAEAAEDATQKGFCDTEIGKAKSDRDYRSADIEKLTAELGSLEAKKDEIKQTIEDLRLAANETATALDDAEKIRDEEHEANLETIKKAREGSAAVGEAIGILRHFYKTSARAKVALVQKSPIDADDPGAGFEGAYRGNQESSAGILGLLEVLKADFDRTLRETTSLEKQAAADHVEFDRTSKADISAKKKGEELNEQDLETTKNTIDRKVGDLEDNQKMLDASLKAIEELKPVCFNAAMSFEERAAKREEEVAALKKALCYLDPESKEEECK
eukprot:TRINITY_DN6748_c0_g1_i1.p1 TRINITY_DN6748_c0_g1~~TRINITY_DN6748_c0_g1_i1.p1  ORF type:complete len:721 (+),score=294.72 TRINITY_DN6748_c0_g1_i1:79-2241(+)